MKLNVVLLILYVIVTLVVLIKYWKSLKVEPRVVIVLGIIVFVIQYVTDQYLPKEMNKDYAALNMPYLQPELVITSTNATRFTAEYLIHNIGKLPADNLRFSFASDQMRRSEFMTPLKRNLCANGRMRWMPNPLSFTHPSPYENFVLIASYTANINGQTNYYHSAFRTLLSKSDISRTDPIPYEDASRNEGPYFDEEMLGVLQNMFSEPKSP